MLKTEWYDTNKKLIYKMAWSFSYKTGIEVEELISEFNVVFCEAFDKYTPDQGTKFSTFFCYCCSNRIRNLLKSANRKKRTIVVFTNLIDEVPRMSYDPVESVIIYDNFVNNKNPIIRKICRIISIYSLPKKKSVKPWLRKILLRNFDAKEITKAFDQLSTLFEK